MDPLESSPIQRPNETPTAAFFSPDGQWIGLLVRGREATEKTPVSGGAPVTLCDAANPFGMPFWRTENGIVWAQAEGIVRLSANGGVPEVLVARGDGWEIGELPVLPDRESLLFYVGTSAGDIAVHYALGSAINRQSPLT